MKDWIVEYTGYDGKIYTREFDTRKEADVFVMELSCQPHDTQWGIIYTPALRGEV